MVDGIIWVFTSILGAFRDVAYAVSHPQEWLAWLPYINQQMPTPEVKESLMRFIYYGASRELFFVLLTLFLILTAVGLWRRPVMWAYVRGLEFFANGIGRITAWVGLIVQLSVVTSR